MKNKLGTLLLLSFLLFVFYGCNNKENLNEEPQKNDLETFTRNLESAPAVIVHKEELSEWLKNEIETFIDAKYPNYVYFKVYKCEWEKKTIYLLDNTYTFVNFALLNCDRYDFRYENGDSIKGVIPDNLYSADWTLIYASLTFEHINVSVKEEYCIISVNHTNLV